jgi:hypothetical protein
MHWVRVATLILAVVLAASASEGAAKGDGPTSIAAGFGSLWVGMGNGDVLRFGADSGKLQARLRGRPMDFVQRLVVGYGAVWVLRNPVSRIDPRSNAPREVPRTGFATVSGGAAGAGSIWAVDSGADAILRVDGGSGRSVARIRVPGRAWAVAAGPRSAVLVSVPTDGPVSGPQGTRCLRRLDPQTNQLSVPLARVGCDVGVAVGSRAVWTLNACTGVLARRDPDTLEIRRQGAMHVLSQTPVLGFGSIWLARRGGVLRVDPTTLRVIAVVPTRSVAVAVGAGSVWAMDIGGVGRRPTVRKIDPETNRVLGSPIVIAKA